MTAIAPLENSEATALQSTKPTDESLASIESALPLLAKYNLLPRLQREFIIDHAIASISCTPEETEVAVQKFCQQQSISKDDQAAWLNRHHLTPGQFQELATRPLRIEKFKRSQWGHTLHSYFLKRGRQLDSAIYSLIRTKDAAVAQELYFRLSEGEHSFAELACEYSQGPEARTRGIVGPVEFGKLHPALVRQLATSQPGQLLPPTRLEEWYVVVRLETIVRAQLDAPMQQRLLNELFEDWLTKQVAATQPL